MCDPRSLRIGSQIDSGYLKVSVTEGNRVEAWVIVSTPGMVRWSNCIDCRKSCFVDVVGGQVVRCSCKEARCLHRDATRKLLMTGALVVENGEHLETVGSGERDEW